jgi:hypothetical protein
MDAIEAIKLSLAEALLDGEWWEVVEDGEGGVFFQLVYKSGTPGKIITLDPRMCIPTTTKASDLDMVVVTGYDPPPCRYAKDFRDVVPKGSGQVNPISVPDGMFTIDESAMFNTSCHALQLQNTTIKSYPDPLIVDSDIFQGQVQNPFFDPKAYEKLSTWVIKVTGMPLADEDAARVQYSFNTTTSWPYRVTGEVNFTKVTDFSEAPFDCAGVITSDTIQYYKAEIRVSNQDFIDKYGTSFPLFIKPTNVLYLGYKVTHIHSFPTGLQGGTNSYVFVDPVPQLLSSDGGAKWIYRLDGDDFVITMYYQPKVIGSGDSAIDWEQILALVQFSAGNTVTLKVDDQSGYTALNDVNNLAPFPAGAKTIISGPGGIGTYVTDIWIDFEIDRPSVTVKTADNSPARPYSDDLRVQYAPIIVYDPPPQKAYKYSGGVVKLDLDALALSLADNDPTTCQNFENTPESLLTDRSEGNTLNITLPFCPDADTCATVAETIYDYQRYGEVDTYALTCGPDDEPELGAAVEGYDTNLRIESINYSYNDGSSYTIEVALGPVFSSTGSWGQSEFGGKYEDVSRIAIVVWSGGDGVNYRVNVQGLGEYNAINSAKDVWRLGERVQVTLKNVPKEVV